MAGMLYLVATPIGNLDDISKRAIDILSQVDLIAAEDTRHTINLLNKFAIDTPMTSFHKYTDERKTDDLVEKMIEGKNIALVTDAGMPAISDPGEEIVRRCIERGIDVSIVPGPSASISALAVSGLATDKFVFEGFLPVDNKSRKERLSALSNEVRTMIIYETPHKLVKTLHDLSEVFGGDRKLAIVRELTKIHEEIVRCTFTKATQRYDSMADSSQPIKGEFVLVVEGADIDKIKQDAISKWDDISIEDHVSIYEQQGLPRKEAMRKAAIDRGLSRRDIYNALLKE